MSIASQQRVIEEKDATIRDLRAQLAQAKADARDVSGVYDELVNLCDEYEVLGLKVIPVATLRHIRPKGQGIGGGRSSSIKPPERRVHGSSSSGTPHARG